MLISIHEVKEKKYKETEVNFRDIHMNLVSSLAFTNIDKKNHNLRNSDWWLISVLLIPDLYNGKIMSNIYIQFTVKSIDLIFCSLQH